MDLFEAIEKRHSYRGPFVPKPVPREDLRKIVQAGILAPSGYNGQSTSFVIVDDSAILEQMGEITGNAAIKAAPAAVVAVADPQATANQAFSFFAEDYSAAAENMLLAATALGYGSVWVDGVLRRDGIAEKLGDLLGVPDGRIVRVVFPVGVPTEPGTQKPKKPFAERAWFNGWQKPS